MKFRLRRPIPWGKIMKITFSQILIAIMVSSITYASPIKAQGILNKKVNVTLSNTTMLEALQYLQKNNNVKFIYSSGSLNADKRFSLNINNQPLKKVLDQVFKNNGINYDVMNDRVVLEKSAAGTDAVNPPVEIVAAAETPANVTITGKVVDNTGQPVPGATVTEKGTTNGITTGADGGFKLSVAGPQSVIVVQFIGFARKEVVVGDQTVINVTLTEDVKTINEVVVVGYGTQKRTTVTGAISSVKATDLQDQQVTRVDDALRGRVTGVTVVQSSGSPGAAPQIRVRGVTSRLNSDPLYVIDGIVVDNGGLDNVNPNDIESIDVLKDASAAIYGSRSSNGVIIVTTKKGKKGDAQISYNGYVGVQSPVSKAKLTNATQYATLRNQASTNDGGAAIFPNPSQYGTGTNWQDQIFDSNALIHNHNLNISGATDKANYYTSFGYLDQQGVVMPDISGYKKFTFTVNTSYKLKKWLTVGENFTYAYTKNKAFGNTNSVFGGPLSSALNLDPITPTTVSDINSVPYPGDYSNANIVRNSQGQPFGISHYVGQEITNPLAYAQTVMGNYSDATNLLGSAFVEVEPIAGLKVRSQISAKQAYYGSDSFAPLYYLNSSTANTTTRQVQAYNRNLSWNWDNTITYNRSFGKHNLTALVGTSAQKTTASGLQGTFSGEPINSFDDASINFALPAANRVAVSALGLDDVQPHTLASYFARVTYDYDQKYLFSGIIRRDGSSKFGSNNVYGTFPSGQVGYVITREDWFPKNTFVDFLKLRASYGVVGNEMALGPFRYAATIGSGRNAVFGDQLYIGYSPNAPANPNLKWEETHTTDIGFDATLFNNLSVTFDVYKKLTKGMLQQVQLPSYAGFAGQPFDNVGDMQNKGVELSLNYNNKMGDLSYSVGGNISYNKNTVLSLGNQIDHFVSGTVQSTNYEIGRITPGQPMNEFYGFKELGVFHSQADIDAYTKNGQLIQPNAKPGDFKWQDTNGDGKITEADRQFLGNPLPTFTYGVNLSANYKNFDFKLFGQGVWGNKIYQAYRRLDIPAANYPLDALNAWTPTNSGSNYPRLTDSDPNNNFKNPSNFYLQNGAYFRIKTLQLGYSLPQNWLKSADIKRVRFFLSSNNLVTITGYKGFDPEISGGIDMGLYPQARTFMAGLDITL
ncbi:TonB-linked SusC/RagA family outer membrane protein [Mucilaginibacter oryzae]|uniref:TonB-linked SusC/RagA family outer membrane protein n=2 Tax=Mucilaginibacter oryzae TaxID=468058 RepID=A0A316HIH1_9SPHI|nr:TonB-linked SusC/RagA family outer membrane protein [Mucilaginibacter oryzae]